MTLEQFLKKLEKTPRDWGLMRGVLIRRKCGFQCPISSLAGLVAVAYLTAASELGIPHNLALEIADAADGDPRNPELRAKLLKACGLA